MKQILTVLALLACCASTTAADDRPFEPAATEFFDSIVTGDTEKAIEAWFDGFYQRPSEDEVQDFMTNFMKIQRAVGELEGYELLYELAMHDRFFTAVYMGYHSRQPVIYYLNFYANKAGNRLYGVSWDTDPESFVKDAILAQVKQGLAAEGKLHTD